MSEEEDRPDDRLSRAEQQTERRLGKRNRREFTVGGVAIVVLLASAIVTISGASTASGIAIGAGHLLLAIGLGVVLWRLKQHVDLQDMPTEGMSRREAILGRLRRERQLLSGVWRWYIGPLLPGFVLLWGGLLAGGAVIAPLIGSAITLGVILWAVRVNRQTARRFDEQIAKLEDEG